MEGLRYANIGIAVCIAITIVGVLVFKDSSEAAMQACALFGFAVALIVANVLDARAKRRKKERAQ